MSATSPKPYVGKRVLDMLVAGTACAAFAPLVAGVAVATWLEDSGSPLFEQSRVGRQRHPFTILKLRSMREQRVTRVGRWLRHTGIDELPQFVNVLRGEEHRRTQAAHSARRRATWLAPVHRRLALRWKPWNHGPVAAHGRTDRALRAAARPSVLAEAKSATGPAPDRTVVRGQRGREARRAPLA